MENHSIEVDNRFAAAVISVCLAAVTAAILFVEIAKPAWLF